LVTVAFGPGSAAMYRMTPHNWLNFLRCHAATGPVSLSPYVPRFGGDDSGQAQGKGGEVANLAGDTLDEVIAATTGAVTRCGGPAPAVLVASPLWLVPCVCEHHCTSEPFQRWQVVRAGRPARRSPIHATTSAAATLGMSKWPVCW
jgi:hypothetical protein